MTSWRLDGELDGIDYHQFYLQLDEEDVALEYADDAGIAYGLAAPTGHAVCVSTGIAMGVIRLTIESRVEAPTAIDDSGLWEAVTEVSVEAAVGRGSIRILMDATLPPFDEFELSDGPGWYRVRAHATGRSLDYDVVVSENPREHHLLQIWRTDGPEPVQHHRIDDQWDNQ